MPSVAHSEAVFLEQLYGTFPEILSHRISQVLAAEHNRRQLCDPKTAEYLEER